jgi:hypothetical protein
VALTGRPLIRGLDLVPGSRTLVALRAALVLLAALPTAAVAWVSLAGGPARQPYFTDVEGRLPLFHLLRLFDELGSSLAPLLALAALIALLGEQLLVAGGLDWLAPGRQRDTSRRTAPLRAILAKGLSWLWPMIKVLLLAALLAGLGLKLLDWGAERLEDHAEVAGWSGYATQALLPLLRGLLALLWLALVGAWAFWCRVLMVADGRRTARCALLLAGRLCLRRPLRGPLFYVALTLLMQTVGALVLALWRQSPPASAGGASLWALSWLLVVVLQAFLWHWLLHAARLLYADGSFDDLRGRPDGPLGLWAWVKRQAGRLRRR